MNKQIDYGGGGCLLHRRLLFNHNIFMVTAGESRVFAEKSIYKLGEL